MAFSEDKITKQHILDAIAEIDRDGVRKGRHSSTYDLIFNGKPYPPKLVLSIANRFANGYELNPTEFEGGKETPAFVLLTKEGFEIIPKTDQIKSLIEAYKKHIEASRLEDEVYKWELVKEFKGRPDITEPNFYEEIRTIKFKNLVYAMGIAVLNQIAKEKPEELRNLFKNLFDENKDLSKRIISFDIETLNLYRELGETLQHHQDERSIATYLTYHNPLKYTFYKPSFYKKYCNLLGIEIAKKNKRYIHYLDLINQLIENYIKPDSDFIATVKNIIPDYYDGSNHKLLAQDILYQMMDKNRNTNYWIFQCNPDAFDYEKALKNNLIDSWTISAHKDKIKIGDKVIIWVTGKNAGCYALAQVTSDPEVKSSTKDSALWKTEDKNPLKAGIEITNNLVSNPILKNDIKEITELENLMAGNQGTNFTATQEQYETFLDIASSSNSSNYLSVKKTLDQIKLNAFLRFINDFVKLNNLDPHDEKISFNVRKSQKLLVFIIGNRYSFSIKKVNNITEYSFISKDKLPVNIGEFKSPGGNNVEAYWNTIENIEGYENKILEGLSIELKRSNKCAFRKYTSQDFINDVYKITQVQKTMIPLNTILFGPPGTGKTYNSIDKAVEIAAFDRYNPNDHKANKVVFDELKKTSQIEFVTFHQNYSYEDFVVGISPDVTSGTLRFDKREGIFKFLAERAKQNWLAATNKKEVTIDFNFIFNTFFSKLIEEEVKEVEIPMRSKSYKFKVTSIDIDEGRIKFTKQSGGTGHDLLVKNLKAIYEGSLDYGVEGLGVYYNPLVEHLKEFAETLEPLKSADGQLKKFVLIIDEINRANISKVFGELITLLEDDKRLGGENELKITLPNGEKEFGVPPNLYIIGTMNTADKSIALIDIALRRRFEFIGYYPKYEKYEPEAIELLKKINEAILKENKSIDYLIGHAYFMKGEKIKTVLEKKVVPLLMEYFSGKTEIVSRIFAETAWTVTYNLLNFTWDISLK